MKKLLLCILFCATLSAESKYPVDVSYFVADLKFSQEHGVKICEIQHGILSTFFADAFLNGENGILAPKVVKEFAKIPLTKWTVLKHIAFINLVKVIQSAPDWEKRTSFHAILMDPKFDNIAKIPPTDPNDIASYQAMIYSQSSMVRSYDYFQENYPGIIIIDAATHPYWIDKYKMSLLFRNNSTLINIKPAWQLYLKQYTPELAQDIQNEIPSDLYVIKPRGAFLGDGVIIVSKENLDETLQFILRKTPTLQSHPDNSYNYWFKDPFDSFLIEKYYPSDLIQVRHLDNKTYEPTIRVAMIMSYDKGVIDFNFLGGYYMVPCMSINEEGTLNETRKARCKVPYYSKAPKEIINQVRQQLETAIPLLYWEMLERN